MTGNIDALWSAIVANQGKVFHKKDGKVLTYEVTGHVLRAFVEGREIKQNISISNFEKALAFMPTDGPGVLSRLMEESGITSPRGASYVWAILMDSRIRSGY